MKRLVLAVDAGLHLRALLASDAGLDLHPLLDVKGHGLGAMVPRARLQAPARDLGAVVPRAAGTPWRLVEGDAGR